ncbi:MAG: 2-oxoacid:acceptor oxidoreductase family protein [Oscillospiraceae bacterium]|nr:2-oxoacid:acceptor oxidoreductase family protein [Oscillospiraceae bacterium]
MKKNIIIAGFGGQGILFAGKLLAYAAMKSGREISWLPSYGPEMRGGTANCHIVVSDEPIGSPIVTNPDILITMNTPSLDKFEDKVAAGGMVFVDKSLVLRKVERTDIKVKYIEATKIAMELGNAALANMVILGAFLKETGLFIVDEIKDAIINNIPKTKQGLAEIDIKVVTAGYMS